ncbi:MAG: hypothetical protein LBL61_03770 [Elusimicrobiota bacterium]|nr:hypothetical protein [Elusimicrobiota bacterium]
MLYDKKWKIRLKSFFTATDLIKSKKLNFKVPANVIMLPFTSASKYIRGLSKKRFTPLGNGEAGVISPRLAVISSLLSITAFQHEPDIKNYNKIMEENLKRLVEIFR